MGDLVERIDRDRLLPPPEQVEQLHVPEAEPLPGLLGPRLVHVVRQQVAAIGLDRLRRSSQVSLAGGRHRGVDEVGVDRDLCVGEEGHGLPCQHEGLRPEGRPRVVRGLVQPGRRALDEQVGPQQVDHLLAPQPMAGRERQHLDQRGRSLPAPRVVGDADPVDAHLEPA